MNIKRKKYCWLVSHTSLRLQRHSAKIKLRIASSSCLDARIIRLAQTRSQEPNVPGTPCIKHEITYVFKLFEVYQLMGSQSTHCASVRRVCDTATAAL